MHKNADWFKSAVAYQIYTRSFYDSNGDGIGDIKGVTLKLNYLQSLGIDIIWISPFCDSPNKDNGYDVSNYLTILKEAGTMDELRELIQEVHSRGMSIMMDLVLNHSSNEHPWFISSAQSKTSKTRDYYIWADGKGKNPPNNWQSYFGGPAWTHDPITNQWYLHHFFKEQPDLNWSNPLLRKEIENTVNFWIKEGIDAFRLDAIHHIGKPAGLPDAKPVKGIGNDLLMFKNTPETHTYLRELASNTFKKSNTFTSGETGGTTPKKAREYTDSHHQELDMIFHFDHTVGLRHGNWDMKTALKEMFKWYNELSKGKGWDTSFLGNHDLPRIVSAMGDDKNFHFESATALATLVLSQWGTPFIYQGEEIGMTNVLFDDEKDYLDEASKGWFKRDLVNGMDPKLARKLYLDINRDNARTPFQWSNTEAAGFSQAKPWMKPNPNFKQINLESQLNEPKSIVNHYKKLIRLRKSIEALSLGDMRYWLRPHTAILSFMRTHESDSYGIILNMSSAVQYTKLLKLRPNSSLVYSNYERYENNFDSNLSPWEARIYKF